MEVSQSGNSGKTKLRYALRSESKKKEDKLTAGKISNTSASGRARAASSVSKTTSVVDLSGKEKYTAKPPRRPSVPAKSSASTPASRLVGNLAPISEARGKIDALRKSDRPVSDVSRPTSRKKFNVLSSASYWLSLITVSEAAANHSISLGFFKLALEAKCEPLNRMRDELKSYARRYNLGQTVKELFVSYNIEQLQTSKSCYQLPEGTRSSDDEVQSSNSTVACRKLKQKASKTDNAEVSKVIEPAKKTTHKATPTQSSDDGVIEPAKKETSLKATPSRSSDDGVIEPAKKDNSPKATPTQSSDDGVRESAKKETSLKATPSRSSDDGVVEPAKKGTSSIATPTQSSDDGVIEPAKKDSTQNATPTQSADDDVRSSNFTVACKKLKPKALNSDNAEVSKVITPAKKNTTQNATPTTRPEASVTENASTPKSLSDAAANKSIKKPHKPIRQKVKKVKGVKAKKRKKAKKGKKSGW